MRDTYLLTQESPEWQHKAYDFLRTDAFVFGQHIPIESEFHQDPPRALYEGILIVEDHAPIGACRITYPRADVAKIERVCVLRERQKQGIGSDVIRAAENRIQKKGIRRIVITSQKRASDFYARLGYVISPETDPDSYTWHPEDYDREAALKKRASLGIEVVLMEKTLQ